MRGAEGLARDLPGADGVVADHDTLAAATENDVVALGALLPDGVGKIAVDVHVIVLHSADAEEVIERKRIELGNVENVGGELGGLLARQRTGSGIAPLEHAVVGLRLEDEKPGERGEKLKRIERFQLLLRGEAIGDVEHVALPPVVGKVLLSPRIQVVAGDQVAAFELCKVRDGGEEIVVADNEDFVGRTGGGIDGSQKDTRCVTAVAGFTTAQIFKMEEGFELVVESGDFRGGYAGRKRQDYSIALNLGRGKSGVSRGMQVQGPEAIIGVGAGGESQ